ncbi:MAG: sulfite exporter TauE/SafE family protein, partial [Alphaproteobacteria bacterium]|nr:sulfite exporter TauE/SafE family protein [Alphaproteobacteria bacterium]
LALGTLIGSQILVRADPDRVILFLGLVMIGFCASSLFQERFRVPVQWQRWLAPAVGLGAGFVGGFSAFFGPLIVMYLVALKLDRDEFVGSMALANFTGAVVLYGSLAGMGRLALPEIGASALALVPVLLGMEVGRRLRRHIEAELFRLALLLALLVMGLNLVRRSVM